MKEKIIASRYSHALLRLAQSGTLLDRSRSDLESFIKLLDDNKQLRTWLGDDRASQTKRQALVRELGIAMKLEPLVINFIELLVRKKRIKLIKEIFRSFDLMVDAANGTQRGELFSAKKDAAESVKKKIEDGFSKKLNLKIELTAKEDPLLIGGLKIRIKDTIWDASIKRQLDELKERICQ